MLCLIDLDSVEDEQLRRAVEHCSRDIDLFEIILLGSHNVNKAV